MISLKSIQTEIDASYLYGILAEKEEDEAVAEVFKQMSEIEHSHAVAFIQKNNLTESDLPLPSFRARTINSIGKIFGYDYILGILLDTEKSISNSKHKSKPVFKSGVLGNYFVQLMKTDKKVKKMKTAKEMNPIGSNLDLSSLDRFVFQQQKLLQLIEKARKVDLTKNTTGISISKMIKLRLGDTFRFLVAHNERHIQQANNIVVK